MQRPFHTPLVGWFDRWTSCRPAVASIRAHSYTNAKLSSAALRMSSDFSNDWALLHRSIFDRETTSCCNHEGKLDRCVREGQEVRQDLLYLLWKCEKSLGLNNLLKSHPVEGGGRDISCQLLRLQRLTNVVKIHSDWHTSSIKPPTVMWQSGRWSTRWSVQTRDLEMSCYVGEYWISANEIFQANHQPYRGRG